MTNAGTLSRLYTGEGGLGLRWPSPVVVQHHWCAASGVYAGYYFPGFYPKGLISRAVPR